MNGAELLLKTAIAAGVEVCFANPGTTELSLVTAFDSVRGIRPYLGLFEGCCAGAADGYGRMLDKPAMTLLHLGPGLGNSIANLHNARRARTPIFNVIGEHATWHRSADPPLTMDIETLAGTVSGWQCTNPSAETLSQDTADAIGAALKGQVASLIVPHDCQWTEILDDSVCEVKISADSVDERTIEQAAEHLRTGQKAVLILGGRALRVRGLLAAARIQAATGCDLLSEMSPARIERGIGLPDVARVPYFPEKAAEVLSQYQRVVLAGAREPVVFFGYRDGKSKLLTAAQQVVHIEASQPLLGQALENLADALDAPEDLSANPYICSELQHPDLPRGKLTAEKCCAVLGALQPEHAIIVNESVTTGGAYFPLSARVPPHSVLSLTGGAIGFGIPCAVGAAIACPDRPVINLEADGSAMYTIQALWMQAREGLNVTTLICSNRRYDILRVELARAGHESTGANARTMMDLGNPDLNWVKLSQAMGVPAVAVDTAERLAQELKQALAEPGPHLIEMRI